MEKLRGVLNVVQDRYETANLQADTEVNLKAFFKTVPATVAQEMECIAAECLDPGILPNPC